MHYSPNYRLLVAVSFLQGFVFYGPAATIYRRAYGLDLGGLFLIESISWAATILLEVPWGRFADRFGYKRTLVIGNLVFLLSKIAFSVASGFAGFLAERLLLAVALAALSGCSEALLFRSVPRADAARAFGRWHAAGSAGLFAAAALFPLFPERPLRATAYATVVPYAAAAVLTCFLAAPAGAAPRDPADGSRVPAGGGIRAAARALVSDRRLLAFLVAGAAIGEASQAATVFLAPLQYERAGIPRAYFGVLFALLQGAGMAAAAAGRFAEGLGRRGAVALILAVEAAALLALSASASPAASIAALVAAASAAALFRPISAAFQNERISGADRATSLSMNALIAEGTAAVLNVAIGGTAERGLGTAFAGLALMSAAAAPLALFALGTPRKPGLARKMDERP